MSKVYKAFQFRVNQLFKLLILTEAVTYFLQTYLNLDLFRQLSNYHFNSVKFMGTIQQRYSYELKAYKVFQ
jgi:hypothetical protein